MLFWKSICTVKGIRILDTLNRQHSQRLPVTRPSREWPCHGWRWCDWRQTQRFRLEIGEGVSCSWHKISKKNIRSLMGIYIYIWCRINDRRCICIYVLYIYIYITFYILIYIYIYLFIYMRQIVLTYFGSWVSSSSMIPSGSILRYQNQPRRFVSELWHHSRVGCGHPLRSS